MRGEKLEIPNVSFRELSLVMIVSAVLFWINDATDEWAEGVLLATYISIFFTAANINRAGKKNYESRVVGAEQAVV